MGETSYQCIQEFLKISTKSIYLFSDMSIGNKLFYIKNGKILRYSVKGLWGIRYYSKGGGIKG